MNQIMIPIIDSTITPPNIITPNNRSISNIIKSVIIIQLTIHTRNTITITVNINDIMPFIFLYFKVLFIKTYQ